MDKRESFYWDIVKGAAIFLMIWGHCIQYCALKDISYMDDVMFKIIYSFHMPLFMLISGYFAARSIVGGGVGDGSSVEMLLVGPCADGSVAVGEVLVGSALADSVEEDVVLVPPCVPFACACAPSVAKRSRPSSNKIKNKMVMGIHLLVLYMACIPHFFRCGTTRCYNVCGQAMG